MMPPSPTLDSPGEDRVRRALGRLQEFSCLLPAVRGALALLRDPDCTCADLQDILAADQGLSARLLRLANSAYFGVSRDVSSLSTAVTLIGFRRLETMLRQILAAELLDTLSARREDETWKVATASATLAFEISRRHWVGDPEELLGVCLLHNAGELALRLLFPRDYRKAVALARSLRRHEAEERIFGVRSERVGRWLLDAWNFPVIFGASCEFRSCPLADEVDPSLQARICVVHVAVELARSSIKGVGEREAFDALAPEVVGRLELSLREVAPLYEGLPQRARLLRQTLEMYG